MEEGLFTLPAQVEEKMTPWLPLCAQATYLQALCNRAIITIT